MSLSVNTSVGKPRLAVIFGGRSSEHGVSCLTAREVIAAIDTERYDVRPVGITRDGAWVQESAEWPELVPGQLPEVRDDLPAFVWEDLRGFEDHVKTLPEVRECHMLNGEIDFILKIVSKDLQSFQEFLTSKLTPAPNVASVKTSLTIRTSKQEPGVPLE